MPKVATTGLLVSLMAMSIATACATGDSSSTGASLGDGPPAVSARPPPERIGDLVKVDLDVDGTLFIREDHQIGGFDAVYFPLGKVSYKSGSPRLPNASENEFLVLLEQSLVDRAESGGFEVADSPGECVLEMQVAIEEVDIARRSRTGGTGDWATLVFAIELSESVSGRPLARYSKRERIISPGTGEDRSELILANYAAILEEIDLAGVVTGVTATPSPPRENCEGTIARIARGERS